METDEVNRCYDNPNLKRLKYLSPYGTSVRIVLSFSLGFSPLWRGYQEIMTVILVRKRAISTDILLL